LTLIKQTALQILKDVNHVLHYSIDWLIRILN
jgi:hypothetical protein